MGIQTFTVFGVKQSEIVPMICSKLGALNTTLLDVAFETNPIDKLCDQRVHVSSRPLQIIYDAKTVIELARLFKPPKDLNFSQLTDVAANKIENVKERSATGLQYMVEKHTNLELKVDLMPTYLVVPHGGLYKSGETSLLIVSLGRVLIQTEPRSTDQKDVISMASSGFESHQIMDEMLSQCYDKFQLNIQDIQIMIASPKEDWQDALLSGETTEMHLLEPANIKISAHVCVIDDDPRLPKTRVFGEIPSIHLCVTEERVLQAIELGTSIPLPESDDKLSQIPLKESVLVSSSRSLMKFLDPEKKKKKKKSNTPQASELADEIIQFTDLEANFVLKEFSVLLYKPRNIDLSPSDEFVTPTEEFTSDSLSMSTVKQTFSDSIDGFEKEKLISFSVLQLEMSAVQRTYDMKVELKLGAIQLDQHRRKNGIEENISVINTPRFGDTEYLFVLKYMNAKKISPEFTTKYNSTEQLIEFNFATLILVLHQQAITELLQIATSFQQKMERLSKTNENRDRVATIYTDERSLTNLVKEKLPAINEEESEEQNLIKETKSAQKARSRRHIVDSIKIRVIAKLEKVAVELQNEKRSLAFLEIQNLQAGVIMKSSYTEISVKLEDINVRDMNPETIHSTILSVVGGNAITCQIVLYNLDETCDYNSDDMKIDVQMGCVKIVFLNWFVQSVLSFLDNFQEAQKAIAEASAAAADAAKQNMVDAYSKATRMKLNIRIKAPVIIVPVDSQSLNAICLDLGFLSITNTNTEVAVENVSREENF